MTYGVPPKFIKHATQGSGQKKKKKKKQATIG